jgi:uncharacterized protein (TIGR02147 family)
MNSFISEEIDYRAAIRARIQSMPARGHGQLVKIARHLGVHPTLITQIFKGDKCLSPEHALLIAEYLGLSELETEYFLALVELDRAGHHKLKSRILARLEKIRGQHQLPQARMTKHQVLAEEDRALFYSSWYYSAIRLLAGLNEEQTIDRIASTLSLERKLVQTVMQFLLRTGLLVQEKDRYRLGPQRTYLPADSALVSRHHTNWRLKAIENFDHLNSQELAFTGPISVSRKDFGEAKKILLRALEEISSLVDRSKEEVVGCMNLDLFLVTKN